MTDSFAPRRIPNHQARSLAFLVQWFSLALGAGAGFGYPPALQAQSTRPGMGSIPYSDATGTGVTFRVWSPQAISVAVPGTFNNWNTTASFLVKEGAAQLWSADIPAARTGHEYKYLINGTNWWKDPRSRKVTYSGYNTSGANSIVYDPAAFNWGGDTRPRVSATNLVIYELHVGTFNDPTPASGGSGKFANAVTRLDHLAALGINAVELLPIAEFPTDLSWGYNPADIFAVENSGYGGPDGLKTFVREAHAREICVLLDVVHNHWGSSDLELHGFDTGPANRIYVYTNGGICCTPWGDRPNYANDAVRSFISDNFRMWLDEYHVDGFRWDAVGAMRQYDSGAGYVAIPEADTLIQSINATIIHPNGFSIAEDASGGIGFDSEWDRGFGDNLISQVTKTNDADRDMNALASAMGGSGFSHVLYSETHDLVGDMNGLTNLRLPKRIDAATPTSYAARKRSLLAAAVVMTTPGLPMLFMGQEMLVTDQFSTGSPLDWSRTNTYTRVVRFYRDLIRLRRNLDGVSPGLTGPNLSWHVVRNDAPWKLLAFHRWGAGANDQVMVVMNFTSNSIPSYIVGGWPVDGAWYVNLNSDWTTYGADFSNYGSSVVNVSTGSGGVAIGPYSVLVLSRQALPNLDSDGDGLLNGWEQQYFSDPLSGVATTDNDLDGMNNLQEQAAGTNPKAAASVLKFTDLRTSGGNLILDWIGGQAARQVIQQATNLGGVWTAIYTNQPPTAVTNSLSLTPSNASPRFYRIQITP